MDKIKVFLHDNTAVTWYHGYEDMEVNVTVGQVFGIDIVIGKYISELLFRNGKYEQGEFKTLKEHKAFV